MKSIYKLYPGNALNIPAVHIISHHFIQHN
ncbi:uncharacterized protein METZ01_LOCUS487879 [marine metagenome]|uniref:Uncharacterized protein n=1 Tax=marine metagenome TaxID=408172 RepID=A0A383CT34_9ZZZZ